MRVENPYSNNPYNDIYVKSNLQTVEQSAEQQKKSSELIDEAVSVNISRLGYTYAGELPVDDSHEVYLARRQMRQGIGISTRINGEFVGILAENYKSMADSIKENYTGAEFDRQMGILDKAYKQASEDLAHEYTQQMRILSGDIVIMPSKLTDADYYSTAAEAEAHQREFDAAWENRKEIISEEKGKQMSSDVLKYLEAAKASVLDKGFFSWQNMKGVKTDVLNFMDLQKMGAFFVDKKHQTDVSGVSSFVSEIISAYTNS